MNIELFSKDELTVLETLKIHGGMRETLDKDVDVGCGAQYKCPNYNAQCVKGCGK